MIHQLQRIRFGLKLIIYGSVFHNGGVGQLGSELKHNGRCVANIGTAVSPWTACVACSPRTEGEIVCVCVFGFR